MLTLCLAVVLWPTAGVVSAYSGLVGGLISTLANLFFASKLFSDRGSWQPEHLAVRVYWGQIGKLLITIGLFSMAVVLINPLDVIAMFALYLLVQISPAVTAGMWQKTETDQG